MGKDYHVYCTDNGKVYAAGDKFLKYIGAMLGTNTYYRIPLEEGVIPIKPLCVNSRKLGKLILLLVQVNGRNQIWSIGCSKIGLLGQDENLIQSQEFSALNYDTENIIFKDVKTKFQHAMALTEDGRLFAWGNNIEFRCGLPENK